MQDIRKEEKNMHILENVKRLEMKLKKKLLKKNK